jgi:hypothetical protein
MPQYSDIDRKDNDISGEERALLQCEIDIIQHNVSTVIDAFICSVVYWLYLMLIVACSFPGT